MTTPLETYEELVTRIAYSIVQGVARGVSAESMAHHAVQQTTLWRKTREDAEKAAKKEKNHE